MVHDGGAEFLTVSPGVPLGVPGGPRPTPITVDFPPGSTLVAFTDGLVEKRGHDLDATLKQLKEVAAQGPGPPDDLINRLLQELAGSDKEDDIVVLAIQLSAQQADPRSDDASPPDAHYDGDSRSIDDLISSDLDPAGDPH